MVWPLSPSDVNGNGVAGGKLNADFQTLSLTRVAGTNVFGYVYDAYNKKADGSNIPIVGATIRVDAFPQANAVTDKAKMDIQKQIDGQAAQGFVDNTQLNIQVAPISFGLLSDGPTLKAVIGGTHGTELFI